MKRRVRIRRRDGIKQRYWVGRKPRKNYGSTPTGIRQDGRTYLLDTGRKGKIGDILDSELNDGTKVKVEVIGFGRYGQRLVREIEEKKNFGGGPLFGKRLQEQGIIIMGSPKEKRIMRRLFERSPEIIKDIPPNTQVKFEDLPENVLGIYKQPPANIEKEIGLTKRFIPQTNPLLEEIQKTYPKARPQPTIEKTPELVLRHEVEHARLPLDKTIDKMREMAYTGELGKIFNKEDQYNLLYKEDVPISQSQILKFREFLARQEQSKTPMRKESSGVRLWPPSDDKSIRRVKIPEERITKSLNRILP